MVSCLTAPRPPAVSLSHSLQVQRQAVMSKYLTLQESEKTLKRPFISPKPGAPAMSEVSVGSGSSGGGSSSGGDSSSSSGWVLGSLGVDCACLSALQALRRKLAARKLFVAWGQTKPFLVPSLARPLRPPELEELPVPTLPAPQVRKIGGC